MRHVPEFTPAAIVALIVAVWGYFSIRPVSALVMAAAGNPERLFTLPPAVLIIWGILSISFLGGAIASVLFNRWFRKFERHVQILRPGAATIISLGPTPAALRWSLDYQPLHRQRCVVAISASQVEIWADAQSPLPTHSMEAADVSEVEVAQPRRWHGPQPLLFQFSDGRTLFVLPLEVRQGVMSPVTTSGLPTLRDRVLNAMGRKPDPARERPEP
ncbi:hypothetical protein IWX81_002658 [Salinibacterium sp. CAN_S4]